ncbi:beta-1,6-N-acetylglucosaminyltransferase [Pseudoalteromonas phenolica]|uniref:beta-1,6-N-acetylglucosaminyltransferase n=1 Tax=Pseudoalteromonas phenolica TaxID=161398 RepID=UPI001487606E|nr:beta-1,6-N-acetylglucosaminyltransferase [Pseudoalteromonas phenolica]
MKIAILIACHKQPELINQLIDKFDISTFDFYIHVDTKSNIRSDIKKQNNVTILTEKESVDVKWGHISQVETTYRLIQKAACKEYEYLWFMSGQDFPIKSQKEIINFFHERRGISFIDIQDAYFSELRNSVHYPNYLISNALLPRVLRKVYSKICLSLKLTKKINNKLYHGSSWFCLHKSIFKKIQDDSSFGQFISVFNNALCPDETVFQTYIKAKNLGQLCENNLTYIDWSERKANPKTLTIEDFDKLMQSEKLIARKFDLNEDKNIIKKLSELY